jgi:hypothetical protein
MIESSQRLGRHRWTIQRTGAWLGGWRRLRIRYERGSERFYALAMLACSVICFNQTVSDLGSGAYLVMDTTCAQTASARVAWR